MPQANDAELTELYTSAPGLDVEDNEPNTGAPGAPPENNFQLHLEAVAGNVIGNGAANYRLELTCIDETLAAPNANMSPGQLNQQFNAAARNHVLRYVATMVGVNGDIVSFIESNRFILV